MENSPSDQYNAQLIRDCGVAVSMDYGPNGSEAPIDNAQGAFVFYFGFKNTTIYEHRDDYTDSEWKDALKLDLSLGRPILYAGTSYGADTTAHAWVIDGYDSQDNFGCNWGYGGANNGYFALTNLKPNATHNYNTNMVAILNLEPVMSNCGVGISGGPAICSSGTSFNVPSSSLPSGATITWQKSDNITIMSAQPANPCTFQANGTGSGWIEATVHSNGSATLQQINVQVHSAPTELGVHSFNNLEMIDGYGTMFRILPSSDTWAYRGSLTVSNSDPNNSYSWTQTSSYPNDIKWSANGATVDVYTKFENKTVGLRCTKTNYCTSDYKDFMFTTNGLIIEPMSIFPNPATEGTTISFESSNVTSKDISSAEWTLEIYDQSQQLKMKKAKLKGKEFKLNTSSWKDGVYIVRAKIGDEVITEKLLVKH